MDHCCCLIGYPCMVFFVEVVPFVPGQTVRLKSGGPLMTVAAVDGGDVYCDWFAYDHEDHCQHARATFKACTLKAAY